MSSRDILVREVGEEGAFEPCVVLVEGEVGVVVVVVVVVVVEERKRKEGS